MLSIALLLASAAPKAGDTYVITRTADTASRGDNNSSGTTHDVDALEARIVAVHDGGMEIAYDLPSATPRDERAGQWLFPARVFYPNSGSPKLLDEPKLLARRDAWLRSAKLTQKACGHHFFTWSLFRIDCEPGKVMEAVERFELPRALAEGTSYLDPDAKAPASLARLGGGRFEVSAELDPARVRRARAEADAAMADLYRGHLPPAMIPPDRTHDQISGTIHITFDTEPSGQVWRRTKLTTIQIRGVNGALETRTGKEVVERRSISAER